MLPVVIIAVVVPKFPTLALPVAFNVPVILAPVSLITIVALLLAVIVTLALVVITTLLFPFCTNPVLIVVMLPVVIIAVVVPKFPTLALPTTWNTPVPLKFATSVVPPYHLKN